MDHRPWSPSKSSSLPPNARPLSPNWDPHTTSPAKEPKVDPAVKQFVDLLRKSETNASLRKNGRALVDHIQSVQDEKRRKRREEMMALKKERDLAIRKIKELEKQLESFDISLHSKHLEGERSLRTLQEKLRESERAKKTALKDVAKLKEEVDDMKLLISLQKHMSQEKNIRAKFETKMEDLKSDLKKSERDIAGLTQELEECIQERNIVIKERNEALARLSQYADDNDRLTQYVSHLQAQLNQKR